MKKKLIITSSFILLIITIFCLNYLYTLINIGLGFKAKLSCSGVLVSKIDMDIWNKNEFLTNPILKYIDVKFENNKVITSLLGIKRESIYRDGIGCTLVSNNSNKLYEPNLQEINKIRNEIKEYNFENLKLPENIKSDLNKKANEMFEENNNQFLKNTRSVLIIKEGKIVFEKYTSPFNENTPLLGWSMTKSVMQMLIGIRFHEDKINIYNSNLLEDWKNDPRKKITLNNLLNMNSGLYFNETYGSVSDATRMLFLEEDMAKFALNKKAVYKPGKFWYYSSGTTNIVSEVLKQSFENKNDYYTYPYKKLFEPLGMKSALIELDQSGLIVGSSYMYANTRDWAKLGQLYLQNGIWNNKRILPENWVSYSTKKVENSEKGKYGSHFWLNAGNDQGKHWESLQNNIYFMSGYDGQYLVIVPDKNLLILRFGQTKNKDILNMESFIKNIIEITDNINKKNN